MGSGNQGEGRRRSEFLESLNCREVRGCAFNEPRGNELEAAQALKPRRALMATVGVMEFLAFSKSVRAIS